MSSIRNTITAVLTEQGINVDNGYSDAVDIVTKALTEREYELTERIVETVYSNRDYIGDLSRDELEAHAEQIGLSVRPKPEPEPEVEEEPAAEAEPASDDDRIRLLEEGQTEIRETLNTLLAVAKRLAPSAF